MRGRVEAKALELLRAGSQLTKYDLAEAAHCDQRTAQRALAKAHMAHEDIRVTGWAKTYRQWIPIYGIGSRDKPKPEPLTYAQKARRRRADPEVRWNELMSKRAKRLRVKAWKDHPLIPTLRP